MGTIEVVRDAPSQPLGPIDETVKIPESVKRAAERANSFYKKTEPDAAAAPTKDAAVQPRAPLAPSGTPVDAPTASPSVQTAAQPSAVAQPASNATVVSDWEQRYASMKGRFDKAEQEKKQLQEQVAGMGQELMRMSNMLQELQHRDAAPKPERLITPEDEQAYGADFIDVVRRAAAEDIKPVVAGLKHEVDALRTARAIDAQQKVYDRLTSDFGDWQSINRSPAFKSWLQLRDPYSGAIRHGLLMDAFKAADAPRVVAIFKGFVTDEAAQTPATPKPQADPATPARTPAMTLEGLAAPGRAASAPAIAAASEKPVFTRADISKFYGDVRRGVYAGRDAEKNAIESHIFAAQREGRVRG